MDNESFLRELNRGTNLSEIEVPVGADLSNADVCGNFSGCRVRGINFAGAKLKGSTFRDSQIDLCNLDGSDWLGCDFQGATFNGGSLKNIKNAFRARNFHTVKANGIASGFETADRPWWVKLDWELIGAVGRFPLLTASAAALVLLPIFFYVLDFYNRHLEAWKEAIPVTAATKSVISRLPTLEFPTMSMLTLMSASLLFVGSLLYAVLCPGRIKQFSHHQWCDGHQRSILDYWALAWRFPVARIFCAACYLVGGALALWIIGNKVVMTMTYIARNSSFTWYG